MPYRSPGCADVLRGARAHVTDFSYMTLMDKSAVKHNMLKLACSFSLGALIYDKIVFEISVVFDAEKHQMLDTELYDLSIVKLEMVFRLLN